MNKQELIDAVADRAGVTKGVAKDVLDSILLEVKQTVGDGNEVVLIGFGTFRSVHRGARTGRNPQNGKPITIPASYLPKFSPGKDFKEAVNS